MKEPQGLNKVKEFHELFGAPVLAAPQIPDAKRCALRVSLLAEEVKELQEAIEKNDLVEIADALSDIQYVLSGAVLEFGLGDKFSTLFDEVHRSNMSKACVSLQEAELTVAHYKNLDNTEAYILPKEDKFLVYRKADNKVLKSVNYSAAGLKNIVDGLSAH